MADAITIKALQDASLDAKSLEEVVNGNDTKQVTTRLGENYPSVKKAIKTLFENGGLPAVPFATKALMAASALVDGKHAMVTDDTVNNGLYVKTAGAWVKSDYDPLAQAKTYTDTQTAAYKTKALPISTDLNTLIEAGTYSLPSSGNQTLERNYPFSGSGIIIVDTLTTFYKQILITDSGVSSRYGTKASTPVWQPWSGVTYSKGIINNTDNTLKLAEPNTEIVRFISQLGGTNLDTATREGHFFINNGALASMTNGFPITGSGGWLTIRRGAALTQIWQCSAGQAQRYGTDSGGTINWQPWSGVLYSKKGIIEVGSNETPYLVVYGSSTMALLSTHFVDLASRKNLVLKNHGKSGDNLAGAQMAQGSNNLEISFDEGVIKATPVPVTRTSTSPNLPRHDRAVTLSNGVTGYLYADSTFKSYNLDADMSVPTSEKYKVSQPEWAEIREGLYIINIGKNDILGVEDNSQAIIDSTIDMIDYLPRNTKFIVGGHFRNQNSSEMHRLVVGKVNAALRAKYGLKYFSINDLLFDDATWVKLGLTKTPEDILAISAGVLPPSLSRDSGHLSPAMSEELATTIEAKLVKLGYLPA